MFVLRRGSDTLAVERLRWSPGRLDGELVDRLLKLRWTFAVTLGSDGVVSRMENQVRRADADPVSKALQSATLVFRGDSVLVEITSGPSPVVQRLKTESGAIPYINPSFALFELALNRMAALGADSLSVPLFFVSGGQTFPAVFRRVGRDSVTLRIAGSEARLAVDARTRILGAVVPAQGLETRREQVAASALSVPAADYSAPAGAVYSAEQVTVRTPMGHVLAGTFTMPKSRRGPVPAVVTITGSGPQERDEEIPMVRGYRPFRQIADTLSSMGIAVLRMDDRGVGGSGGDATQATSADFADDIRAGLAWLRARPEIDGRRLGLIGHSEGGLIAPLVAVGDSSLAAIVLMAGPSQTGRRILEYLNRYAIDRDTAIHPDARDSAMRLARERIDSMGRASPWVGFFLDYDPTVTAARVTVPTLILQGETDRQVTADQAERLANAMRAGGNRDVSVHVFKDANHLFLHDPDGGASGYSALPSSRIRDDVIRTLTEWLRARMAP
jgi:hypothetical protein